MNQRAFSKLLIIFVTLAVMSLPLFAQEVNKVLIKENCIAYEEPKSDSPKSAYIKENELFQVVEESDNYYGIELEDGTVAYIEKNFAVLQDEKSKEVEKVEVEEQEAVEQEESQETEDMASEVKNEEPSQEDIGIELTEYAKQFVGTPYVSGGTNLTKGVDCSGFTQTVYKKFGISLERRSRDQFGSNGVKVSRDELKPGDLVFYYSPISHVAIYIGDGKIVHASTSSRGVVIDPISMRGMTPVGYKRVLN